jgi:hypothetical protein
VINLASLLGGAQSRRHNKYAAQTLFERNGLLRAKSGANSAAKAGVFIPLCHPFFIQHNGVRWAPLHAGAAAGTGFGMAIAVSLTGNLTMPCLQTTSAALFNLSSSVMLSMLSSPFRI